MDDAAEPDEARPPLVGVGAAAVVDALGAGAIVAVPNVGGYSLAVRAGSADDEAKLVELAADPDGPHYAVGQIEDVRALTSGWTDELGTLLERCVVPTSVMPKGVEHLATVGVILALCKCRPL